MKIVFLHGWSFDASIWTAIQGILAHTDILVLDQGQTANAIRMTLPEEPFLAVGHSAGVLWFLDRDLPFCRGLIAINGFSRFTQTTDFTPGITPRLVGRLQTRLTHDAEGTVTAFRRQIAADPPVPGRYATEPLHDGLSLLLHGDGRMRARALGPRLVSIEGRNDPLLPDSMRTACFAPSPRLVLPAGHLLPLTHAGYCASVIEKVLDTIS